MFSFSLVLAHTLIFFLPHWKLTEHLLSKPFRISSIRRGSRTRRLWELPGRLHQLEKEQGSHSCPVSTSPWLCHSDWTFSPSLLSWQHEVKERRCFTSGSFCFGLVVNEVEKDVLIT